MANRRGMRALAQRCGLGAWLAAVPLQPEPHNEQPAAACSVEGLSLTSFASEACCYGVQVAYNVANRYPFSTFGDTAMCWLQNVAIIGLIFVHG